MARKSSAVEAKEALTKTIDNASNIVGDAASSKDASVESNASSNASADSRFNPHRISSKGTPVKQEKIADAITGDGATSGSGYAPSVGNSGLRAIPYSGTDARIIDNASGTPTFDKSDRRDSRYGQKTDNTARHINYVPSETYLIEQDGPLPLSESADKVQGSLGHPANEFARVQKASEAFPGAINFERSIDEYAEDLILATEGQQVTYGSSSDGYDNVDPKVTFDEKTQEKKDYFIHRGNYVPEGLHVRYNEDGELLDYYFDEENYPSVASGDITAERANTNLVTAANRAELDRQVMANNAGDEKDPKWNPIPYAYPEPTRDTMFLTTVEQQGGASVFAAVKMAAKAHSYQVSKAAKDGMRSESAGAEICVGSVYAKSRSTVYDALTFGDRTHDNNSVFHRRFTSIGAPSGIIVMNDSPAKYHDRADVLTQPRSFNMVLKNGLSNYKRFMINPNFARVFDNMNTFSTIDKPYDPSQPVCLLDGLKLMNPYSLNELGSCFRTAKIADVYEGNLNNAAILRAMYDANRAVTFTQQETSTVINHVGSVRVEMGNGITNQPLTNAVINAAAELVRTYAADVKKHEILNSTSCYAVSVFNKVASDASPESRFRLLLFYFYDGTFDVEADSKKFTYTLGTTSVPDVDANTITALTAVRTIYNNYLSAWYKNQQNWYYIQLRDPYTDGLKTWLRNNYGMMGKVVATSDNGGVFYCPVVYSTKYFSTFSYLVMMALKYMQEQRGKAMLDVLNYEKNFGYPFSLTETLEGYPALGGKQYGQSDIFNQLEVRQMSPDAAVHWIAPEMFSKLHTATGSETPRSLLPWYFNEQDFRVVDRNLELQEEQATMSYPVTRAGVRWAYLDDLYGFEERDLRLCLDRLVSPPIFNGGDTIANPDYEVYKYSQSNDGLVVLGGHNLVFNVLCTPRELGFVFPAPCGYVLPKADESTDYTFANTTGINVYDGHPSHRVVCWVNRDATPATCILGTGSSVIQRAATFAQKYYIFYADDEHAGSDIGICLSIQDSFDANQDMIPFTNGVWGRGGQRVDTDTAKALKGVANSLFFRVQRIPGALCPFDFAGSDALTVDPFTFLYVFGFVGFKASDYKEDLYNRLTKRMADGWKFVTDPFIDASLILK